MACGRADPVLRCIAYLQDDHPRRLLLHCDKGACFVRALRRFAYDARCEGVRPFAHVPGRDGLPTDVWVPRSRGGWSAGRLRPHVTLFPSDAKGSDDGRWLVRVEFEEAVRTRPPDDDTPPPGFVCTQHKAVDAAAFGIRPSARFAAIFVGATGRGREPFFG